MRMSLQQAAPALGRRWSELDRRLHAAHAQANYVANLRHLNDVLGQTEFADKYWVMGGLLIGWARQRTLLAWDFWDADFAYRTEDRPIFHEAGKRLIAAGFRFQVRWLNNAGVCTQTVFTRQAAKFEFFEFSPTPPWFEYTMYGFARDMTREVVCQVPEFGLEPIPFLDRTWFKPDDHDRFLTATYGNWRIPRPDFNYLRDQKDIVSVTPWNSRRVKRYENLGDGSSAPWVSKANS